MRAFRSLILATGILATGLVFAGSQAHAGVHIYVTAGPSAPPYYAGYASPYPGYTWAPEYYDAYGNYYPGRWIAVQGWRGREWRDHEWREHRGWDGDGEGQRNWRRHEHRDRDDRHHGDGDE